MYNPKRKILIGVTGSIAATLTKKIIKQYMDEGYYVSVILTESSKNFVRIRDLYGIDGEVYTDLSEWEEYDPDLKDKENVLHIQLRDEYEAFVIVPASANTIAKIANGICDNLITTVARAWLWYKPMIIAPAMNTEMWDHPITNKNIHQLLSFSVNNYLVEPQVKELACGQEGNGALANISDIVKKTTDALQWNFPLDKCYGLPGNPHQGSFAFDRKGSRHTGMDLYTDEGTEIHAVEDGVVVGTEHFTGEWDNSPWWENTDCILIRGASGVVVYGELQLWEWTTKLKRGDIVKRGSSIGTVKRVIKRGRDHYEIPGWRPSMLHMELYPWNQMKASNGFENFIIDPTSYIMNSNNNHKPLPEKVTYTEYLK